MAGPATEYAQGIPITLDNTLAYFTGEFVGAWLGAVLCYLCYKKQYDDTEDATTILATFSTIPTIRSRFWNCVTEAIGTFVLVFVIIMFGHTPNGLGPLAVALLVVAIGASLGGPTGYAINPARDMGRVWRMPCCRSGARVPTTGVTPGCPSSARSSAAASRHSPQRSIERQRAIQRHVDSSFRTHHSEGQVSHE